MKQPLQTRAQVLRQLGHFTGLLVTGPQRSGTTIASMMLAKDLGLGLVDERDHGNNLDTVKQLLRSTAARPAVLQGPELSMHLDELRPIPGVCVVWMLRRREDVIASQDRIGWTELFEDRLVQEYRRRWRVEEGRCRAKGGRLCDLRLQVWRKYQRDRLAVPWVELEYAAPYIQNHILYVPREERTEWTAKQTSHKEPA